MKNLLLMQNAQALLWSRTQGWYFEDTSLLLENGKIKSIGSHPTLSSNVLTINLKGLTVLPGLIDSQVHFREPGFTHKEDLETGTLSAALGGITTVFEMPNTNPATTSPEELKNKFDNAKNRCHVNYAFYSGGSKNNSHLIQQMEQHPNSPGLKIFMGSSFGPMLVENDHDLEQLLIQSSRRVTVHCEDEAILNHNKSELPANPSVTLHSHWRSPESGLSATKRLVTLAKKHNKKVHVLHVTTKQEVDFLCKNADTATFEILPQHLTLHAPNCYEQLGSLAQQNPPIREIDHQNALWNAIEKGWVKTLGSDHAPHTLEEKSRPYPNSPSGMPGVQTILPIMLNHVHNQKLTLFQLVELMTSGPIEVFGLSSKGRILPGFDADFTVVDLKRTVTLTNKMMATKSGWSPFDGYSVTGFPVMTIINGRIVMQDGELVTPHQGTPAFFNKI